MSEPMFPILNDPIIKALPWALLKPHEKQAMRNHSQSLNELARRGGLGIQEAYLIIKDMDYRIGMKFSKHLVRYHLILADCRRIDPPAPEAAK